MKLKLETAGASVTVNVASLDDCVRMQGNGKRAVAPCTSAPSSFSKLCNENGNPLDLLDVNKDGPGLTL